MSIYNRDNINYSQMIQNAITNRNAAAQRQAAYDQAKGKLWGDTTSNIGNIIGEGIGGYNKWKGDTTAEDAEDAELEMLKKKLEEYKTQQDEADAYRGQVQTATNLMEGYHPNVVGTYSRASLYDDNPYKLPGNSNATQSDYMNYIMEMNRLYGGR